MPSLPLPIVGAFAALTLAIVALWAPRVSVSPHAALFWTCPCAVAAALALVGGLIDVRALLALSTRPRVPLAPPSPSTPA